MKKIAGILLLLALIIPNMVSAQCCNLSNVCSRERNAVNRLEKKIDNIERRIAILQARIDRLEEEKDEELEVWDEKCYIIKCAWDKAITDGEAVLRNYLNSNPDCGNVCSAYIRLQKVVDRKVCAVQKQYERCERSRAKCADRFDRRIDHIQDQIAKLNAELGVYTAELEGAKIAWQACYDAASAACPVCVIVTVP